MENRIEVRNIEKPKPLTLILYERNANCDWLKYVQ